MFERWAVAPGCRPLCPLPTSTFGDSPDQVLSGWDSPGRSGLQEVSSATPVTAVWPWFLTFCASDQPGKGGGAPCGRGSCVRTRPLCRQGPLPACLRRLRGSRAGPRPLKPGARQASSRPAFPGARPHGICPATQLQASGLPGSAELTAGAAVACFLALEGADLSYANHRGRSPLDLAAEGRLLKALQGCAQRFR